MLASHAARSSVPAPSVSDVQNCMRSASGACNSMSRYRFMPVPAGISLPMMMFSLRPKSMSLLPSMAASVSTRVVSWNDAAVTDDGDLAERLLVGDADHARGAGQDGGALRGAGLEQLDDAGQTVGDVLTGDTTGVEGPHGQLRAGLTDGLGGDDADSLTELDLAPGGQRAAVAGAADAVLGLARQHRAHHDLGDVRVVAQDGHLLRAHHGAGRERTSLTGQRAALETGLEVRPLARRVGVDVMEADAAGGAAVDLADDELLRHVDQQPRQGAGVGGAQGRVRQPLPGAVD